MITYAQIEAIHEAMRELGAPTVVADFFTSMAEDMYDARDVEACFAKIRAALAGEVKPIGMSAEAIAAAAEIKRLLADEKEGK